MGGSAQAVTTITLLHSLTTMAPITLISAPPSYITKEQFDEFQASTPATGNLAHDPVLHLIEKDVKIVMEPAVEGFAFDNSGMTTGDLYVTEGALSFFVPSSSSGFSIPYPTVSLHAISRQRISTAEIDEDAAAAQTNGRNSNGHPAAEEPEQPCVYCQLDENEGADYDNLPEDQLIETKEFSIFPTNSEAVQTIYAALTKCASLYPSTEGSASSTQAPAFSFGDEAAGGDPDFAELLRQARDNETGQEDRVDPNLTPAGRAQLARLEGLIDWGSVPSSAQTTDPEEEDRTADAPEGDGSDANAGEKRKR